MADPSMDRFQSGDYDPSRALGLALVVILVWAIVVAGGLAWWLA